jgi:hypothetical protein
MRLGSKLLGGAVMVALLWSSQRACAGERVNPRAERVVRSASAALPAQSGANVRVQTLLALPLPGAALPSSPARCRTWGMGIPDARLSAHVRLGADAADLFAERVRLYLKIDPAPRPARPLQLSVDVGTGSGVFLVGSRF